MDRPARYARTVLLCLLIWQPSAAETQWQSSVVTNRRKEELRPFNSPHLALDSRGFPHVAYVEREPGLDTVMHATGSKSTWTREPVLRMQHSPEDHAGVASYGLAVDRFDRLHLFIYSGDYPPTGPVFEERWARRAKNLANWRMLTLRRSEGQEGGAGMFDPHVAVDSRAGCMWQPTSITALA